MAYEYNQAPKEFSAQSAAFKKKHSNVDNLTNHIGQIKYDGVFCWVHTDTMEATSRQGTKIMSVPHIVGACGQAFGPGWVVFMELYQWATPHKEINGAVRRQAPQPQLRAVVFDAVPAYRFEKKLDPTPYGTRLSDLLVRIKGSECLFPPETLPYLPNTPWTKQAMELNGNDTNACDGLILRDMTAEWCPGASKNGEVIKVKPVLSLDLLVVGAFVKVQPTKLGGTLSVTYNGVISEVGSGLTQDILGQIKAEIEREFGEPMGAGDEGGTSLFDGKIIEVECMGITPDGKLREPRFKSFRFDTVAEEHKGD